MKLTNLLPISSEQSVMEGVTFGRSQMNMVQQSDNIQIGIEYEFTLDEVDRDGARTEHGGGDPEEYMDIYRNAKRELEEEKKELVKDDMENDAPDSGNAAYALVNAIRPFADFNNAIDRISEYVDLSDSSDSVDIEELDEDDREDLGDALQNMGIAFQNMHKEQGNLEDFGNQLEESYRTFIIYNATLDHDEISDFETQLWRAGGHYDVESLDVNPFEEFSGDALQTAVNGFVNVARETTQIDIYDDLVSISNEGPSIDEVKDKLEAEKNGWIEDDAPERVHDIFGEEIEQEAIERADDWERRNNAPMDNHDHADLAKEYLNREPDLMANIDLIHPDGPGVLAEAKGSLVDIEDGIAHMHEMLEWIQRHAWTDEERAGMHVNVSMKDHPMTTEYFNPIKLVMLMNDGFVDKNFPARDIYTAPVFEAFEEETLISIVERMIQTNTEPDNFGNDIVRAIEIMVNKEANLRGKQTNFNINGVKGHPTEENRVEFRFFGGGDYEQRGDEMEFEIYRAAYSLMAAFDDEFLRRQYVESLWNFVDDEMENTFKRSLSDVYRVMEYAYRQYDDNTYDEIRDEIINNPTNIEVIAQNASRSERGKSQVDLDPSEFARKIIGANENTIIEITDEYFDTLISVLERGKHTEMRSVVMSLNRSRTFQGVASASRLEVLSGLIAGDIRVNTNDATVESMFLGIARTVVNQWMEEEADRDMIKRFDQRAIFRELVNAVLPIIKEYVDEGGRTLDDLRDVIDFIRLS